MGPDPRRVASRFLSAMLTMKKTPLTIPGARKEFQALNADRKEIARIYQREVTREVFRQGQEMAVPVLGWFYRLPGGPERGMGQAGPQWISMTDAVRALTFEAPHTEGRR